MSSTRTQWVLELIDKVTKPLRNITQFGNKAKRSISGVNRLLERVNSRSQVLSRSLKRMSIAGLAFGALSIGSVNFAHSMARANTMAQVGTKEISQYSNQIRDLSEVIPIAKTQLSEGLYATISAGVPKDNWISFLNNSARTAIGANAQLGTVVNTTASIVKGYNLRMSDSITIQDKLAKTVEKGQIKNLEDLANALPRVTALSYQLNVSQSELLGTFATASAVMGKGSAEVSTQLNAVYTSLMTPSSEALKMAERLKIAFDSNSIGRAGGLSNFLDELMPKINKLSKLSGETKESIIGKLFGSSEAVNIISGLSSQKLSKLWKENTLAIKNSGGTVNTMLKIMASTTKSQTLLMKNSFSNAMDGIVDVLAPFAIVVFKVVGKVFKLVSGFMRANPTLSKFIIIGTALIGTTIFVGTALALVSLRLDAMYLKLFRASLGANVFTSSMAKASLAVWNFVRAGFRIVATLAGQAIGYVIAGVAMIGSYVVGLVSATAAQWAMNIALSANPIGALVLSIAAAIAIIVVMIKYWKQITGFIYGFGKAIINIVDIIFPGFKKSVIAVFSYVKNLVFGFWESIKKVWTAIKSFFGFGDTTEIKVSADVEKLRASQGKYELEQQITDGVVKDKNNLNGNAIAYAKGEGSNSENGTGKGKSITMTLNITNHFKVGENVRESVDNIADKVIGKITDRLRDAEIALG